MSHCIVSVGVGQWYPRGLKRLERSLNLHGWGGEVMLWNDRYPDGCPTHQEQPYAFKIAAIEAARNAGHDTVMWIDTSGWAIADPIKILQHAEVHGHYFWTSGFGTAQWTNDRTLEYFGVTREWARTIPMIYACVMVLDFRYERTRIFFEQWKQAMNDGVFAGSWTRQPEDTEAMDYTGHRHDQSAASVIAGKLGMDIDMTCDTCRTYEPNPPETVKLLFRGL